MSEVKDLNSRISAKMRNKLFEKRIKQTVIAKELGVADVTVSMKLNGKNAFTVGEFAYICAAHDFSPADIFEMLTGK